MWYEACYLLGLKQCILMPSRVGEGSFTFSAQIYSTFFSFPMALWRQIFANFVEKHISVIKHIKDFSWGFQVDHNLGNHIYLHVHIRNYSFLDQDLWSITEQQIIVFISFFYIARCKKIKEIGVFSHN